MVYIELEEGYDLATVAAAIKADPYFASDETHVNLVPSVDEVIDMGHGVNLTRKGVSGTTQISCSSLTCASTILPSPVRCWCVPPVPRCSSVRVATR